MKTREEKENSTEIIPVEVFTIPRPYLNLAFQDSCNSIETVSQCENDDAISTETSKGYISSDCQAYPYLENDEAKDFMEAIGFLDSSHIWHIYRYEKIFTAFVLTLSVLGISGSIIACILLRVNVSSNLKYCTWIYDEAVIHLSSPNYPMKYLPHTHLIYCLTDLTDFCTLKIDFQDLDLSSSKEYYNSEFMNLVYKSRVPDSSLTFDYLKINNFKYISGSYLINKTVYLDISNDTNFIELIFISNKGGGRGFNLTITKETCESKDTFPDCLHSISFYDNYFYTTKSFYPDNLQCSWQLDIPNNSCSLSLMSKEFEMEQSPECMLDSLVIANLTLCGFIGNATYTVPLDSTSSVVKGKFISDSSISGKGFNISLLWNLC